jgi:hypothetical protein
MNRIQAPLTRLIFNASIFEGNDGLSHQEAVAFLEEFDRADRVAGLLKAAAEAGAGALLCSYQDRLLAALEAIRPHAPLELYPVVLNAAQYARDLSNGGTIGAAWIRLSRAGLSTLPRLARHGVANLRGILARDFMAFLPPLLEMEMSAFTRFHPPYVFLHAQMTDLALATGNRALFQLYADFVRRSGAQPGLQTRNLGLLAKRLREWEVNIRTVVAPFNGKGYRMHPSRRACERLLGEDRWQIIADDATASRSMSLAEAVDYLQGQAVAAVAFGPRDEIEARQAFSMLRGLLT